MTDSQMFRVATYWNDVAHDFDAIYSGKKSVVGRALDHWFRDDMYGRFRWVMERVGDVRDRRICDIGCGSGRFVSPLAQKGAYVTGVDVAPEMLKLAEQLVRNDGVADRCRFVHSDILDWQTREQFDVTIAIGFWDYIAEPASRLQIIRAMTRDVFLSAWPRFGTWRMPVRKLRLGLQGCPVYFYRRGDVVRLLREAGFAVESVDVVGKLFCVKARPA
jgi:SAM-dependent methyltransferase